MRIKTFAIRNFKELSRDPLGYIFCIGFPILMLIIMSLINDTIPPESGMTTFRIDNLGPGIVVFGLTFVMLFTSITVAQDRSNALLTRLYASPMTGVDFILGYTLPMLLVSALQVVIVYTGTLLIASITDVSINFGYLLLSIPALLPSVLMFIGFGIFFGTLLSEKSAPGLCSLIICMAGMLGGIWMDVSSLSGALEIVCKVLPFYHGVTVVRKTLQGDFAGLGIELLIICCYALVILITAIWIFARRRQKDAR